MINFILILDLSLSVKSMMDVLDLGLTGQGQDHSVEAQLPMTNALKYIH